MRAGIVITCYNQARYLAESLQSVLEQTIDDWEAVVVDDASPDGRITRDIVDSLNDRRIRMITWGTNRGVSAARNAGIRETGATAFVCVDADDKLHPRFLERLVPILEAEREVDCTFPDLLRFGLRSDVLPMRVPSGKELLRNVCPPGAGTLMRRSLWERIGGYDEADPLRIGLEDREFFIRAFASGCRAVHVAEPLYLYRISRESRSTRAYTNNHVVRQYIYRKHRAIFDAAGEGRRFVATGFDRAARAARERGARLRSLWLSVRALLLCPSTNRLRSVGRFFLPERALIYLVASRQGRESVGHGMHDIPVEEMRNRLLRRVDWRFLLPEPSPGKSVCFSDGLLAEAVRLVSAAFFDRSDAEEAGGCDLAVTVDPDRRTLELAHASLRPGGCLYSEWRDLLGRGRTRVRRRLESAGFDGARFYWPHPDPSVTNPAAWIPLRGRSALRHYFIENRGKSRTRLRGAARKVMRTVSATAPGFCLAQPVCTLARKPAAPASEASRNGLDQLVMSRWSSLELGPPPQSLSWLLLTGGLRSDSKIIALLFADSNPRPVIALKMPRTPESGESTRREGRVLRSLLERLGTGALSGVPRFLFLENRGSVPVLGETAFMGVPLLSAWTRDNYGDLALRASAWLVNLAGRRPASPPEEWWHRLIDPVLAEFARAFGPVLDSRLFYETEAFLKTMPALPLVCEQRDFSPWNVLLTPEGELAVVDWESAELDGLPALDLIYFLTHLCFSLDSAKHTGRYRDSYMDMLDPRTPRGALAERCFSMYCDSLGIHSQALRPLRLLTWLVHARSEYRRLQADFGPTPSVETLREAVCVQLWEEELRDPNLGGKLA